MTLGPFKALEDLTRVSTGISEEALRANTHTFGTGVYFLWDGEKVVPRPIIPEILSEVPLYAKDSLMLAEAESVFGVVEALGLPGFCYIHRSSAQGGPHYNICVIISGVPMYTATKFSLNSDTGDLERLEMTSEDWTYLERVFFSSSPFRRYGKMKRLEIR